MAFDNTSIATEPGQQSQPSESFAGKVWNEMRLAGGAVEHIPEGIWNQILTYKKHPSQLALDAGIGLGLGLLETVTHEPLPEVEDQFPRFGDALNRLPRIGTDWKFVQAARKVFPFALAGYGAYSVTAAPMKDLWEHPSDMKADQALLGNNAGEALGTFMVLLPTGALTSTKALNQFVSLKSHF